MDKATHLHDRAWLSGVVELAERERTARRKAIDRTGARTSARIAFGYRKLFPMSMATLLVIGMTEYTRRTNRYERFVNLALRAQRRVSGRK